MILAADDEDGSGLQVEKVGPTFSSCHYRLVFLSHF